MRASVSDPLPAPLPPEAIDLTSPPPIGGWSRWQVAVGLGVRPHVIDTLTQARLVRPPKDGSGRYVFGLEEVRQTRAILEARRQAKIAAASLRAARQAVKAAKAVAS